MRKALLVTLMLFFSLIAPFDFSGTDFNFFNGFALAEEGALKNSPPVAIDDFYKTEVNVQLTVAAPGVLENDSDPDGNMLLSAKISDPKNGMAVMGTDGRLIYAPDKDFIGTDSFTYTVYDGVDGSATATVTIVVGEASQEEVQEQKETPPKNNPPVAVDDHYITAANTQLAVVAPGVIQNDSDPDGDFLLTAVLKEPANGKLSLGTDGGFTYLPGKDFAGTDSFTYSLHDGNEGSAVATVTIIVASSEDTQGVQEQTSPDNNLSVEEALVSEPVGEGNLSAEIPNDMNLSYSDMNLTEYDLNMSKTELQLMPMMMSAGGGDYDPFTDSGLKPYAI